VPSAATSGVEVKDATLGLGQRTDVVVIVRDAAGSELENVTVTLSATGGGNLIDPASAVTRKKGEAKFQFSSSEAGTKTLTAVAGGVTIAQQPTIAVAQAATTTRIVSDAPDPSAPGASVTVAFTVTSDAGTPTGDVTVSASAGGTCTATVAVGQCDLVPGGGGPVTLLASYAGAGNFAASSGTESHTVSAPNQSPTGGGDSFTGTEDEALVVSARGVLANDSDPDGDALQAVVDGLPAHGQVELAADGGFRYVPAPDFSGEDGFTYHASDGALSSSSIPVSLTVAPVNDPPSFTAGPDESVAASGGPQSVPGWVTGISPGPADESGQQVVFLADVVSGGNLFSVAPAVAADGTLTFTPSDVAGSADVRVTARDDGGRSGGGNDTSSAENFTITLTSP
jgi:hypothetical protein